MTKGTLRTGLVAIFGSIVGAGIAIAAADSHRGSGGVAPTSPPAVSYLPPESVTTYIERTAPATAATAAALSGTTSTSASPDQPPETAGDLAASYAQLVQDHQERLAAHTREARRPIWATRAERQFMDDLTKIGNARGFTVVDIDCRTSTCAAHVDFRDYGTARRNWVAVAGGKYANNCGTEVVLQDPAQPHNGPSRASVLFNCADGQGANSQ